MKRTIGLRELQRRTGEVRRDYAILIEKRVVGSWRADSNQPQWKLYDVNNQPMLQNYRPVLIRIPGDMRRKASPFIDRMIEKMMALRERHSTAESIDV